jgi:hypothetical protein
VIVRGVRAVNFRGVREMRLAAIPERGVVALAPPAGADAGVACDALRFAFRGGADDAARVVSDGAGFAHVEVALSVRGGDASLFRGVDRRGSMQVSLREESGLRVTGGADAVRARLEELAGAPLTAWDEATFVERPSPGADPFRAASGPARTLTPRAPRPSAAAPAAAPPPPEAAELRDGAERAVDRLRRSLRADALRERVESEYAALCGFGGRLRRERTETAVAVDRATAERDRVRVRVRRVGEYRDLVAQRHAATASAGPAPVAASGAPPEPWAVRGTAACAVALLLVFAYVRTAPDLLHERALSIGLGLAFLAAGACYVHVAADADADARRGSARRAASGDEWRDALRHRFADLGDPDDPRLLDDLRARLPPLDAEIEPLRKRLEQLDEALAAFDVEAGRASRVTHGALPAPPAETASGLEPGESAADAVVRIGKLGDAVYHAAVERDALKAGGAESPAAAADAVRSAFRALGDAFGEAARAEAALERAGLAAADSAPAARDADLCVRLSEEAAALGRRRPAPPPPAAAAPERARPDAAALLGDVVERITGRAFVLVQDGPRIDVRLQGPGDAKPSAWGALPLGVRERLSLALRLRAAEASIGAAADEPRFVVLDERPVAIGDDAAIAEVVSAAVPRVAQVFVPPARPAPAQDDAARRAASAGA